MTEEFIRDRITQLRLKKNVSEYQMSYDLGHSRGYVYNISSGKALPPLKEFLAICDYFEISPQQFFDTSDTNPTLIQNALDGMKQLDEGDMLILLGIINRFCQSNFLLTTHWSKRKSHDLSRGFSFLEQGTGIEPAFSAWEADALPMY